MNTAGLLPGSFFIFYHSWGQEIIPSKETGISDIRYYFLENFSLSVTYHLN